MYTILKVKHYHKCSIETCGKKIPAMIQNKFKYSKQSLYCSKKCWADFVGKQMTGREERVKAFLEKKKRENGE